MPLLFRPKDANTPEHATVGGALTINTADFLPKLQTHELDMCLLNYEVPDSIGDAGGS
jgi:hypothetical protein